MSEQMMICKNAGNCTKACYHKIDHVSEGWCEFPCHNNGDATCIPVDVVPSDLLEATAARICLPHNPELWTTLSDEFKQVYLDEAKSLFRFLDGLGVRVVDENQENCIIYDNSADNCSFLDKDVVRTKRLPGAEAK